VRSALLLLCIVASAHAASLAQPAAYAAELASLVNDYRASKHVAALKIDPMLSRLAREHSADMVRAKRLSHDDFKARFRRSGYGMCVENVGWNYATPAAELKAWQDSPGHDRNMLDARVTHVGIGVAGEYVTFIACR
jgi:uncharacterized protein YkwD